jgi:hypothetical protein
VRRLGLDSESVVIGDINGAVADRLRVNDATRAEIIPDDRLGVELNSMTSDQFVQFVKDKHAA